MPAVDTPSDAHAVEAALSQLPPDAERLLRLRFGIGTASRSGRAVSAIDKRHVRRLEASALRTLRLNAVGPQPS